MTMVTSVQMRAFALECQEWAQRTGNPSDRQTILNVAGMWTDTARAIEHALALGAHHALPDLRCKLD